MTATNGSLSVALAAVRGWSGRIPNSKKPFLVIFSVSHQGHVFHGEQLSNAQDSSAAVPVVAVRMFSEGMKGRVFTMRMWARRSPAFCCQCHSLGLMGYFAFPQKGQGSLISQRDLGTSTSHVLSPLYVYLLLKLYAFLPAS